MFFKPIRYRTWAVLAAALTMLLAACGGGEPGTATFDLTAADRALAGEQSTFIADQGDTVTFNVTSDERAELHLHGYDLRYDVGPDEPLTFTFLADATGNFAIEMHVADDHDDEDAGDDHEDVDDDQEHEDEGVDFTLGAFEVHPR